MGGRGSAGGKSGGSASKLQVDIKAYNLGSQSFTQVYQEKFASMNDKELNRAYINTRNHMKKETAKFEFERSKLEDMRKDFLKVKETDSDYKEKWNAFENQIQKVSDARSYMEARTQIHYIVVNEKYNVRGKKK